MSVQLPKVRTAWSRSRNPEGRLFREEVWPGREERGKASAGGAQAPHQGAVFEDAGSLPRYFCKDGLECIFNEKICCLDYEEPVFSSRFYFLSHNWCCSHVELPSFHDEFVVYGKRLLNTSLEIVTIIWFLVLFSPVSNSFCFPLIYLFNPSFFFKRFYLFIIEEGKEKGREILMYERNLWLCPALPEPGSRPAAQACAWPGIEQVTFRFVG